MRAVNEQVLAAEARACKPGVPTCVFLSEKSTLF